MKADRKSQKLSLLEKVGRKYFNSKMLCQFSNGNCPSKQEVAFDSKQVAIL